MIQRREEKSAPARAGVYGGERGREKAHEHTHAWGGESPLAPLFICFFLPPGPALYKLALARSAVALTPVLGPSFVPFLQAFPFLVF